MIVMQILTQLEISSSNGKNDTVRIYEPGTHAQIYLEMNHTYDYVIHLQIFSKVTLLQRIQ